MSVTINGTSGVTFNDASNQTTAATGFGFKNRLINSDMRIDQRNAGASVAVDNVFAYTLDRWQAADDGTNGAFSVQQDTSAPVGFVNSAKITVTTAATLSALHNSFFRQSIEGLNVSDLGWGTASASTVTLSFWVRSSLTGLFGGAIVNNGFNRSYPFSYSISAANTWEYKTVTIEGDTSGTWLTTNGRGLIVILSLGAGSDVLGTSGAWVGANKQGVTGQVNLITTLNATFYITGVQLEKGSTATSFDYRPYGTELALCQRYYQNVVLPSGAYFYAISSAQYRRYTISFLQEMRSAPTCTATGVTGNSSGPTVGNVSTSSTTVAADGASGTTLVTWTSVGNVTASAEL